MGKVQELQKTYNVKITNFYEDYDEPQVVRFLCYDQYTVETMIAAYSTHYSGDPIEVFINGEKAVLNGDWGLAGILPEKVGISDE